MKFKEGDILKVTVTGIQKYGIFVNVDDEYNGLIHISEISNRYVKNINKIVKVSDKINAEVLKEDTDNHQLQLSIKNINNFKSGRKKHKIKETNLGFKTLAYNLPRWIEKSVKKDKKVINSIDKQ